MSAKIELRDSRQYLRPQTTMLVGIMNGSSLPGAVNDRVSVGQTLPQLSDLLGRVCVRTQVRQFPETLPHNNLDGLCGIGGGGAGAGG